MSGETMFCFVLIVNFLSVAWALTGWVPRWRWTPRFILMVTFLTLVQTTHYGPLLVWLWL